MIPYSCQDISNADIDAVVEVLRSDWLTQGPMVPMFEQAVSNYVCAKYAVATNSATSALHIACLALGVGPGDCVWTSPNTFVASANCALYCGASIDFVDIDPRTYNMSVERLAVKLEQAKAVNQLPKVVIPVDFAGQPCDMPAIYKLSEEYGFKVVEDASHAIGASYDTSGVPSAGRGPGKGGGTWLTNKIKVGSCTHSHITVFSFHPVKIITTGEGGMALTNDSKLAERMCRLRTHGITKKSEFVRSRSIDEIWNYEQIDLGYNYRMTDIQAALGLCQLKRLDDFVSRRHDIAAVYDRVLKGLPIITPWQQPGTRSSYHLYPIRVKASCTGISQQQVYDFLRSVGIAVNIHYIPVYRHPFFEAMGFQKNYCREAELYYRETLSLPIYPALTKQQQDKIALKLYSLLK
jgi:dTDP-4-amino-4,6-dideoxygalactose transaminase